MSLRIGPSAGGETGPTRSFPPVAAHSVFILFFLVVASGLLLSCTPSPGTVEEASSRAPRVALTAPEIALDPVSGAAGTAITVRGSGWPVGEMVVVALADDAERSAVLTSATAGADGTVEATFIYPASVRWLSAGVQRVVAYTAGDDVREAEAAFAVQGLEQSVAMAPTLAATVAPTGTLAAPGVRSSDGGAPTTPLVATEGQNAFALLNPDEGTAGTRVVVSGGGFPPSVRVNVYLAGVIQASAADAEPTIYASATTDSRGNYVATLTMPATWPDGANIEDGTLAILVATDDFAVRATGSFGFVGPTPTLTPTPTRTPTITPRPTTTPTRTSTPTPSATAAPTSTPPPPGSPLAQAQPRAGGPGTRVTVQGDGFPANAQVAVQLARFDGQVERGSTVQYALGTTDAVGRYNLAFTMPTTWPDGTTIPDSKILILVATTDFSAQASDVFDYLATVATPTPVSGAPYAIVSPAGGGANTTVTIRGGGFPANSEINLYLAGVIQASETRQLPTATASTMTDFRGNYSLTFTMPATWPDGAIVEPGKLALLVATADFALRATGTFDFGLAAPTPLAASPWRGEYYNNTNLAGAPVLVREDASIDFFWETGSPDPGVAADSFSVRWTNQLFFQDGLYRLSALADDGIRIWIDGFPVLDEWHAARSEFYTVDVNLTAGPHTIRVEYYENTLGARVRVWWEASASLVPTPTWTPVVAQENIIFDDDPRNNRRQVNSYFCSGFETDCEFGGCDVDFRLLWGPFCREGDHAPIKPGYYQVTLLGTGPVRAGATDFGATGDFYAYGQYEVVLPATYTFCWPGRQSGGYGFETIVQSLGSDAQIERIVIAYLGEECR